jgi:hypothetical protein
VSSDFDALVAAVAAGISAVDRAKQAAQEASIGLAESAAQMAQAVAGTSDPEMAALPGIYDQVRADAEGLAVWLGQTSASLVVYLEGLGRSIAPETPQVSATPQTATSSAESRPAPEGGPQEVVHERAEALRGELPPQVERGKGQKTHGRWMSAGPEATVEPIVSGEDAMAQTARDFFVAQGARRMPTTVTDVEVKLAVHMRTEGITDAAVTINNFVCVGPFGCDTLLPKILPEGSTLTVYGLGEDGEKTVTRYTGQGTKR